MHNIYTSINIFINICVYTIDISICSEGPHIGTKLACVSFLGLGSGFCESKDRYVDPFSAKGVDIQRRLA